VTKACQSRTFFGTLGASFRPDALASVVGGTVVTVEQPAFPLQNVDIVAIPVASEGRF